MLCTHTLQLFISGKDKRTSSSMSRSSSGFESSHLPSPEYPAPPLPQTLTLTHPNKSMLQSIQGHLPCILPSQRETKTSLSPLIPGTGHLPHRTIARSRSWEELGGINVAPWLLRRCLSLRGLHTEQGIQSKEPNSLKDWEVTHNAISADTKECKQHISNAPRYSDSTFLSSQASATLFSVVPSNLDKDKGDVSISVHEQAEISACTHLKTPLAAPGRWTKRPIAIPSVSNPCRESLLPKINDALDVTCTHTSADPMALENGKDISTPAQSEGQWMQLTAGKNMSINAVNLEALLEERLLLQGIDLTMEPFSDKVSFSSIQQSNLSVDGSTFSIRMTKTLNNGCELIKCKCYSSAIISGRGHRCGLSL